MPFAVEAKLCPLSLTAAQKKKTLYCLADAVSPKGLIEGGYL